MSSTLATLSGQAIIQSKSSPLLMSTSLCCQNDLKGAIPVPGPTMITGVSRLLGSLKSVSLNSTKVQDFSQYLNH